MNKFDFILIAIAILIAGCCYADYALITHGFEQFSSGFWAFVTAVCTGEVVTYSIYRVKKKLVNAKNADDVDNDQDVELSDVEIKNNIKH